MKRWVMLGCVGAYLPLVGLVAVAPSASDEAADIREAALRIVTALNAGDVDGIMRHHLPTFTLFDEFGGLLDEVDRSKMKGFFDAGLKINRELRHLDVKVYGNTAVDTTYWVGTSTLPDGTVDEQSYRVSGVWIKQGGAWKTVHVHLSPLTASPRSFGP